jgi:hypothetical protein
MPTADRRPFVVQAIRCFLAQDHAEVIAMLPILLIWN